MRAVPAVDGAGQVAVCPDCPNAPWIPLPDQPASSAPEGGGARLRQLLASPGAAEWPASLLDDLPEHARSLLTRGPQAPPPAATRRCPRCEGLVTSAVSHCPWCGQPV